MYLKCSGYLSVYKSDVVIFFLFMNGYIVFVMYITITNIFMYLLTMKNKHIVNVVSAISPPSVFILIIFLYLCLSDLSRNE